MKDFKKRHFLGVVRGGPMRDVIREAEREALEREEGEGPGQWSREKLRQWTEEQKIQERTKGRRREEYEMGRTGAKQTVIVKKSVAKTRGKAAKVAEKYADRIYTSRQTKDVWRFRQRPPSCFQEGSMKTWCKPGNGVCIVYGTLKKGADKRKACK